MTRTPKRPRDTNQLAKMVVDIATGNAVEAKPKAEAQRKDGLAGASARAAALTSTQRSEIASVAAQARWKKSD